MDPQVFLAKGSIKRAVVNEDERAYFGQAHGSASPLSRFVFQYNGWRLYRSSLP